MTYEEQLHIQQLNKQLIETILANYSSDEINAYYFSHTRAECLAYFKLRTEKQLLKLLKLTGYDFTQVKPTKRNVNKVENKRSHESYILGGQKSACTQKTHWEVKSETEKQAWAKKMSDCHLNSPTFKAKIGASNSAYRSSLSTEENNRQNEARSVSMKAYWQALTQEERTALFTANNFKTYNCSNSGPNLAFAALLDKAGLSYEREFCLERKRFDFKVKNVLVELDPTFTHNSTFTPFEYSTPLDRHYHQNKTQLATKYGYRCIHIFDWDDQDKVVRLLQGYSETIAARKCQVKDVSLQEAREFINTYHLQGYARASIRIGLYYEGALVSIMTFSKPRYNKNYEYELVRYCAKAQVLGGAERLLHSFKAQYNPKSIISYCDLSKFSGITYIKLGFTAEKTPSPSKHYYNIKTGDHFTEALVRQHGFSRLVHHCDASEDPNTTTSDNRTLLLEAGFVEVFDCGQAVYTWKRDL